MSTAVRVSPFDRLASEYDERFTQTPLGSCLRQAVWRRLDARFAPGQRVLELGCGTGEDAVHLATRGVRVLATDASTAMVEAARRKVEGAGLGERVEVRCLAIEELSDPAQAAGTFDGAFSSFGALNCLEDLEGVAHALARHLAPRAAVVLCVMGPLVPWEWVSLVAQGRPGDAFRRLRPGGTDWRGLRVRYPSIRRLRRAFAPAFRLVRAGALGVFLPPTWLEGWMSRHPGLLGRLAAWERRLETVPPLPWLADHYLAELERVP